MFAGVSERDGAMSWAALSRASVGWSELLLRSQFERFPLTFQGGTLTNKKRQTKPSSEGVYLSERRMDCVCACVRARACTAADS